MKTIGEIRFSMEIIVLLYDFQKNYYSFHYSHTSYQSITTTFIMMLYLFLLSLSELVLAFMFFLIMTSGSGHTLETHHDGRGVINA